MVLTDHIDFGQELHHQCEQLLAGDDTGQGRVNKNKISAEEKYKLCLMILQEKVRNDTACLPEKVFQDVWEVFSLLRLLSCSEVCGVHIGKFTITRTTIGSWDDGKVAGLEESLLYAIMAELLGRALEKYRPHTKVSV